MKVCPLHPRADWDEPTWIDLNEPRQDTTPNRWEDNLGFWEALHEVVDTEPALDEYRAEYGELAALGIEKGRPFAPDDRMKAILERTAHLGHAQLRVQAFADRRPDRVVWPGRQWEWAALRFENGDFERPASLDTDAREKWFYQAIGASPAMVRRDTKAGSLYWLGLRDGDADRGIRTKPGVGWFVYFRIYGPEAAAFDGSWQLPDFERISQRRQFASTIAEGRGPDGEARMDDVPTIRIDRSVRRSLSMFSEDRLGWLDRAAALGPLSALQFGRASVFVVTDVEVARAVLVTDRAWTRPPSQRVPVALAVGENLFSASDRKWAQVQPAIAPAFRRRALAAPLEGLDELLAAQIDSIPTGEDIDLGAAMARLAFIAAAWVMLGDRVDASRADELVEHQRHVVDWVGQRLGALSSAIPVALGESARRMREHRRALEDYVEDAIRRAHRADTAPPILSAVGAATATRQKGVSAQREQLLGLLLAGNETTAAALCWLLVEGAAEPDEWRRLTAEPDRARGFVDETLRLYPPAWGVTRTPIRRPVAVTDSAVSVRVRRPGIVTLYLRGMQRSPKYWSDPLRFDPDRHADTDAARNLIPFALGPRGCVGQHLALEELRIAARLLAARGDLSIGAVEEDASFALRPRGGLRGQVIARVPHQQ